MKIFGVSVVYDEEESLIATELYKKEFPGEGRQLRVYEITDEFDRFRKYRISFGFWDTLIIHVQKIWSYWVCRRRRYSSQ